MKKATGTEKVTSIHPTGRVAQEPGEKFQFKQPRINQYFRSKYVIDFDKEVQELERERLRDKKRRKELEWLDRKKAHKY